MKTCAHKKDLDENVYSSSSFQQPRCPSIGLELIKLWYIHSHGAIFLGNKREHTTDTYNGMKES